MGEVESTRFDRMKKLIKNNRLLSIVLLVGTIVIAVASFTNALTTIITFVTGERTQLEVTDILVEPGEKGTVKLDIRIVNNSKKTITVSRLRLTPLYEDKALPPLRPWEDAWAWIKAMMSAPQKLFKKATGWGLVPTKHSDPTAKYYGKITKTGEPVEIPVAHDLESGKADRFFVVVDMNNLESKYYYTWNLDTELVTNVGIASGPRLFINLPYKYKWPLN